VKKRKSILFVRPDYHCSFFLRDEFRKLGWKADIFLNPNYQKKLLYSDEGILTAPKIPKMHLKLVRILNNILLLLWWLGQFWRYDFHFYYGRPPILKFVEERLLLTSLFGKNFIVELWLAKLFGIKLIYLPSGCNDDESKANFTKSDNGHLCGNCGMWNKCNDTLNNLNFSRIRKYFDMQIGVGAIDSTQFRMTHLAYKSIDLNLWNPNITVPLAHQLPATDKLRILHSSFIKESGRNWQNRNEKGSPFVLAAIERLQSEGYPVEYFFIENKPSNQMRFYQVQADIVVEQLIYGWWGSTGVETMALGKPVVCFIRPSWKSFFLQTFSRHKKLPIVEANINTVYDVLKKLVTRADYRMRKGEESRRFAEKHFDPEKNTRALIKALEVL
jgi:hypothetical protein